MSDRRPLVYVSVKGGLHQARGNEMKNVIEDEALLNIYVKWPDGETSKPIMVSRMDVHTRKVQACAVLSAKDCKEIIALKSRAKEIKRERGIKHSAALNAAAIELGFRDYNTALGVAKKHCSRSGESGNNQDSREHCPRPFKGGAA